MMKNQQEPQQTETDRMVGEIVMYGLVGMIGIIFFLPALVGMLIFAVIQLFKREWISYVALCVGFVILFWHFQAGTLLTYFGLISEMNVPYMSTGVERLLNDGDSIESTASSYGVLAGLALLFSFGFFIFAKFFWKKRVTTKAGEVQKQKAEQKYKAFRKNRVKFLDKKQKKYRDKPSKEVFVGYTDFKERVALESKELNYHMLATGGTGTGKTTLIASLMESALQQEKPIIFMDGKGERKSMLEFKALCEAYGRNVYLFSEMDDLTYNPIKNGTPTETRDKLMSLFSFSSEGDGAYYTDIASRYLQLVVKLIDEAGVPREIKTIARLTNVKSMNEFFKEHSIEVEIEEEIEVEVEEKVVVGNATLASQDDDLSGFIASAEPKTETIKKTVVETRKRSVTKLQEGMQRIKKILDDEFPEEIVEGCLTRLKMQLGELLESDLGHLFVESEKGIDLQKITDNNDVVIFSISGSRYADYIKKIGKMIILDVNSLVAYRQAKGRKSIFGVYDEFSAYGDRRIVDIVNKSRSAGFECIISTQTLSDIDAIDPIMTEQIISNCNIIATGRVNSSKDAERIAKVFGTYSDREITQQIEKKYPQIRYESSMGTVRDVDRFKANPSEIKNLQIGEIFINRKMVEEEDSDTYFRRVYVRNALDLGGIK
ncbi:type IV secretion system DNA-binding domain-containing protein [Metabacillus rhizolycopersici]|uniref:Type IV secretion system DNA-binding domain-containing protein n=1 Tax=Metabacillus rhizolycopersici TaxID=2875709 RepID=A0ABS7UWT2_9BACI|nr:type IV secretion system DNA-binding domain-containing protein [Metabacillus rhizolycopersici]MBZ5752761.1 type IV secretion system DNA-binding domain-containing protein [Metabacillus rhizolycopersici]